MIILEVPHQLSPSAYRVYGIKHLREIAIRANGTVYEKTTARKLLDNEYPDAQALADAHGLDTPLYRSDYLLNRDECEYSPEEIDEQEAILAYIGDDLHAMCVYETDDEALRAMQTDNLPAHQRMASARALRKLLT